MRVVYLKTTLKQKFPKFDEKWVTLGFGIQGVVYSDGKYAYKCCLFNTNYVKWLLDLRRNKLLDNPYTPKIHKIYVDKRKRECLVQMELLTPGKWDVMELVSDDMREKTEIFLWGHEKKPRKTKENIVLKQIADFVKKQERAGNNICLDLHGANVMMRRNQLVITDPVV